ncbi:MAG TPA: 3-deoxy-8-phosphooctulonate synthase [Terriglobia bacterium]|nr:3-deoxy-8-phosphooctulonate synthase [Terriglobia bacterium]
MPRLVRIGKLTAGSGRPLFVIAGPCVIESERHTLKMAEALSMAARDLRVPYIFKASFDKANRTSLESFRGPGLKRGLKILVRVKTEFGIPVLTDVHDASQVIPVAEVCDVVQIPAFLSRQTDLLVEAGRSGAVVNIKKGQFLSPWDVRHAVEKVASAGNHRILLTERGSSFGYNNLVVDMRGLKVMSDWGYPVILDVTHSLQLPGGAGAHSGGQPEFIKTLARAGVAAGVDGVFMEVHDRPSRALSDGANALPLRNFKPLLRDLRDLAQFIRKLNHQGAKTPRMIS